jgi:hypothetical protein
MPTFPATSAKAGKANRGATDVAQTPLEIRARPRKLGKAAEAEIRERVSRAFGHWAPMIAAMTARIEDENGPKGGVDRRFALQIDLTGHPPVHVEHKAATTAEAEALTIKAGVAAMKKLMGRLHRSAGRTSVPGPSVPAAQASPRKRRGHERRNDSKAAAVLEDSASKPSRKSTRGSSNHQRAATPKQLTSQLAASAPTAVATRARATGKNARVRSPSF